MQYEILSLNHQESHKTNQIAFLTYKTIQIYVHGPEQGFQTPKLSETWSIKKRASKPRV